MSESLSPLTKVGSFSARAAAPMMSLDYGPSTVSSPVIPSIERVMSFEDPMAPLRRSVDTTLSSPRVQLGALNSPTEVPIPMSVKESAIYDSIDPLTTVAGQQRMMFESRVSASAHERQEKRRYKEEKKRKQQDMEVAKLQDLARSIEIDKSRLAKLTFEQMLKAGQDAEELRREKWQRDTEEREYKRERRENERWKEFSEERERLLDKISTLEGTSKRSDDDRDRRMYRQSVEKLEDMQKQSMNEIHRLRLELSKEKEFRVDTIRKVEETHRLIEDRLDTNHVESVQVSARENTLLTSEIDTLKQDKVSLQRQLDDTRDELRHAAKAKDKEIQKLHDEVSTEKRAKASVQERLERDKRDVEDLLHQRQRDFETREWKLQQEYDLEKRAKQTAEDDLNRELQQLRRELEMKTQSVTATRSLESHDAMRERDLLQQQLRTAQDDLHKLKEERDKFSKDVLGVQKEALGLKERDAAMAARLDLEKERYTTMMNDNADLKKSKYEADEKIRTLQDQMQEGKWELQRVKDSKDLLERSKADLDTQLKTKDAELRSKETILMNTSSKFREAQDTVQEKEVSLARQIEELKRNLDEQKIANVQLKASADIEKTQLTDTTSKAQRMQDTNKELEASLRTCKSDVAEKEAELARVQGELRKRNTDMQQLADINKQEVTDLKADHARELLQKTTDFTKKETDLKTKLDSLTQEYASTKSKTEQEKDKQVGRLKLEIDSLGDKERLLQGKVDDLERNIVTLKADVDKERKSAATSGASLDLLTIETREGKMRSEVCDSEKVDVMWHYHSFVTSLNRVIYDTRSQGNSTKSLMQDDMSRMRLDLDREKGRSHLLEKDITELQFRLKETQEDKTAGVKDLRCNLDQEIRERGNVEQELSGLRKEADDKRNELIESTKMRKELTSELEELKMQLKERRPVAAAAAGAPSPSNPPQESLPQLLVLRARADLCEDRKEALMTEKNNGLYALVSGGLCDAVKDAAGTRASWPASNCVWERQLPTQRWIYSSKRGAWKVTDGMRSDGSFNLAAEVDEGLSFECLLKDKNAHDNVLPHEFTRWCKGVTVEEPPRELFVTADKTSSSGKYKIISGRVVNGWPVWKLEAPNRWLYNTQDGAWQITDSEADFTRGGGLLLEARHNAVLPHLVSWDSGVTVSLFAVNEMVRMRDRETDSWQQGIVDAIHSNGRPLVKVNEYSKGYQWLFVEKLKNTGDGASGGGGAEVAKLESEVKVLQVKIDQNEKMLRDKEEALKEEKRRLAAATKRITELEEEVKLAERKGGGGGGRGNSELEAKLKLEIERRLDVERQVDQFKEAKERNEGLLMQMYEEKPKLEQRVKELEKQLGI